MISGYKRLKMNIGEADLTFDFYKPLDGEAEFTVCELAYCSDKGKNAQSMSTLIEYGMKDFQAEIAEADYLADMLGKKTPAETIDRLREFYRYEKGKKTISTMRGIHNERGIRLPGAKIDDLLDPATNFSNLFETAYQKIKEEQGNRKFSHDDCEQKLPEIQQLLRRDNSNNQVSLEEVTRVFRRAGLEAWKRLFQMTPDEAAQDIFNAQKDKRNSKRRRQVPYIITDIFEFLIDHPYRHAMETIISNSGTSKYLPGAASKNVNCLFYHYPQRFLDGITPALHPLGPMLLRSPSFVEILQKLYGGSPSDSDGRDFILACHTAARVYVTVSKFDNDEIKMKQSRSRLKLRDPKILEETLWARPLSD